ncbi:hypothetical protein HPB52_021291 [Rhipicephalus sanguineus]|uniref:Uncharacterized protein n=1 Tax=Rhipicephalus sanguineus TaxID=34632 RepID=A0A9D4T0M9_RHISA|nr:hypothetical protein HPB52_021291 [Rhipicephalus sanguineus]
MGSKMMSLPSPRFYTLSRRYRGAPPVRRSRQDYLVGRLAHRYDPDHVATLPPAEWTAQPPLDDRSRRADAGFLNLPLPRCSRRAGVGLLRRTAGAQGHSSQPPEPACRRLQSSTVAQSHQSSTRRPCGL